MPGNSVLFWDSAVLSCFSRKSAEEAISQIRLPPLSQPALQCHATQVVGDSRVWEALCQPRVSRRCREKIIKLGLRQRAVLILQGYQLFICADFHGPTLSYDSKMSVKNWLPNALSSTEQSYGTSNLTRSVSLP